MLTTLLAAASAVLLQAETVDIQGRDVRLGDIARLEGVAGRARGLLESRVVARFDQGRSRMSIGRAALAGLVRRAVPGLAVRGGDGGAVTLRRLATPRAEGRCFVLGAPVASGATLIAADAEPAPCRADRVRRDLRFEPESGTVVAGADLPAGTYLGRIELPSAAAVVAGDQLTLIAVAGPVRIQRRVVAMQAGSPGRRLFVRTQDGEILAAALPEPGR